MTGLGPQIGMLVSLVVLVLWALTAAGFVVVGIITWMRAPRVGLPLLAFGGVGAVWTATLALTVVLSTMVFTVVFPRPLSAIVVPVVAAILVLSPIFLPFFLWSAISRMRHYSELLDDQLGLELGDTP